MKFIATSSGGADPGRLDVSTSGFDGAIHPDAQRAAVEEALPM